jgi:hypothetical protein
MHGKNLGKPDDASPASIIILLFFGVNIGNIGPVKSINFANRGKVYHEPIAS